MGIVLIEGSFEITLTPIDIPVYASVYCFWSLKMYNLGIFGYSFQEWCWRLHEIPNTNSAWHFRIPVISPKWDYYYLRVVVSEGRTTFTTFQPPELVSLQLTWLILVDNGTIFIFLSSSRPQNYFPSHSLYSDSASKVTYITIPKFPY